MDIHIKGQHLNKIIKLTKAKRKGEKITPQLRISGKFLQENGFKIDDNVDVLVRDELLIIQPLKPTLS